MRWGAYEVKSLSLLLEYGAIHLFSRSNESLLAQRGFSSSHRMSNFKKLEKKVLCK